MVLADDEPCRKPGRRLMFATSSLPGAAAAVVLQREAAEAVLVVRVDTAPMCPAKTAEGAQQQKQAYLY